jgi:beta-lactamase regulating signal transducer with metallopeptidase domain
VTAETMLSLILRVQLLASVAILLVLVLRPLASRWCGARITYWLWLIVPVAMVAGALPARSQVVVATAIQDASARQMSQESVAQSLLQPTEKPVLLQAETMLTVWLLGFGGLLAWSIRRTRLLAASASVGPALVGVFRPQLVLPADFDSRFNAEERALILAHEETHRLSRHNLINALAELMRCAGWFNPIVHVAATRFRADQELSCDAAVIAAHPSARRTYAEALLKAQVAGAYLPLGCMWTSSSARRLAERIARLTEQLPGRRRRIAGMGAVLGVGIASGYAAWAQQPSRIIEVPGTASIPAVITAGAAASQIQQPGASASQIKPQAPAAPAPEFRKQASERQIQQGSTTSPSAVDGPVYTGERMSVRFENVPARTLLQLIAHTAGKRLVVSDKDAGNMTLTADNVPWDHMLDIVVNVKGLARRIEGNVIFVGPESELGELVEKDLKEAGNTPE